MRAQGLGQWVCVVALGLLMAACGGGDLDDAGVSSIGLPDCKARPELCK